VVFSSTEVVYIDEDNQVSYGSEVPIGLTVILSKGKEPLI
jgi:hypothetical protein